ncbi:MAG: hypothetical protein AAFW76_06870, partial [Pseudomonadota bacterium]
YVTKSSAAALENFFASKGGYRDRQRVSAILSENSKETEFTIMLAKLALADLAVHGRILHLKYKNGDLEAFFRPDGEEKETNGSGGGSEDYQSASIDIYQLGWDAAYGAVDGAWEGGKLGAVMGFTGGAITMGGLGSMTGAIVGAAAGPEAAGVGAGVGFIVGGTFGGGSSAVSVGTHFGILGGIYGAGHGLWSSSGWQTNSMAGSGTSTSSSNTSTSSSSGKGSSTSSGSTSTSTREDLGSFDTPGGGSDHSGELSEREIDVDLADLPPGVVAPEDPNHPCNIPGSGQLC